ncbi:MAG TPA: riboflavin synthase [Opitutales bacterium]|nr:riboflavin synthase [Opitutales bacterium]
MFTGIVEATGRILSMERGQGDTVRLTLDVGSLAQKVAIGDSVAVNGCCLTVVAISGRRLSFDLLGETVRCTSIGDAAMGALVNLELSMQPNGRMGGHFVAGHVDGTGTVRSISMEKDDVVIRIDSPADIRKFIVHKGSIAIDGISLTVAGDDGDSFHVCLIPHTLEVTNLREKKPGDRVNLESDILARYVEKLMRKE